ncbi:DUF3558 domain-containing protein [Saccharomonospora sp. NPDC046836]|uniref:DUF3558 domain-containing protein n=1 Tax=Saccharomonospora sp. NPDC046836 TaxID=3156921 RepID=UPI0033F7D66F
MRLYRAAPLVLISAAAIASCSSTQAGTPQTNITTTPSNTPTTPAPTTTTTSGLPAYGAPKVENPIDNTQPFQNDPCSMLTADQVREIFGKPLQGEASDGTTGLDCSWRDGRGATLGLGWVTSVRQGLSPFYANRANNAFFEELPPINGNPTIAYGGIDDRAGGYCQVVVGVTDELVYQVSTRQSQSKIGQADPCEVAHTIAGMTLDTMRGDA